MRKSMQAIVGRSDQNLSSALDTLPDHLHVHFADMNPDYNYNLIVDHEDPTEKKGFRRKSSAAAAAEFDRQTSNLQRKIDQFEAARHGNLEQIQYLYGENRYNPQVFFNRQDPETKLTALHYAARFHHLHICQFLVETCGVDVNKPGEDGMTPLHYMARFRLENSNEIDKFESVVKYLIQKGADIDARDDFNSTPLHHACERNNVHCAEILIKRNANIEATDRQKMHPLHGSCFYGSLETARVLIKSGADILAEDEHKSIPLAHACQNSHYHLLHMFFTEFEQHPQRDDVIRAVDDQENTLLHLAVAAANVPIVDLLLEKGADPLAKRKDQQTALHLCAKTDSIEILEKLINAGGQLTDADKDDETVLHKAATHNQESVIRHILSKQADRNFIAKKNSAGLTALLLAATLGHSACVSALLEHGADMFNDRDRREQGAIYLASMNNHLSTLEVLLQHAHQQADEDKVQLAVNDMNRYNRTSLHAAAELGHVEIVKELLRHGASLTKKDDNEFTPLMLACKKNRLNVLTALIEHINAHYPSARGKLNILEERDDASNTALHIAAEEGHSAIIKVLLEQNCDIQARNMISWLPIHCAADRGRYNSLRVLIENHSPIDPIDKNQQTPLHLAARNGHADVVKVLLKNGAKLDQRTSNRENCLDLAIASNRYNVAEVLVNHRDWQSILRNANYDEANQRWDTPLRKLIRRMPEIALIVLNKCCQISLPKKTDEEEVKTTKKKKKKKGETTAGEHIIEMKEHLNRTASTRETDTAVLAKDETQLQRLTFVYNFEFLDDQFLLKKWSENNEDPSFEPDGILYPGMNDPKLDRKALQENHPFTIMVDKNREELLDHPVVHSLLDYKWTLYARYVYYFNFLFYLIFVAALTTYVFITFAPYRFGVTHDQMQEMSCRDLCEWVRSNHTEELETLRPRIYTIRVFQWLVIVLASVQIIKECFQIQSDRLEYLNSENIIELTAFILAILFTVDYNSCSRAIGYRCVVQWQIGALSVFLAWLALVLFIQKFPQFGIYVVMLTDILRTFARFFLVFFLFIIGFALAFHMLLQNHNPFQHFGNSLLKTCVMMIGEFEYEGIFHGDDANYFGITYFFFVIFIIVMSIIIMNLLVGLAVDDIATVRRAATVKRLAMRVKLTLDVEKKLPQKNFFDSIRRFRTVKYREAPWHKFLRKVLRIPLKTAFDKNRTRLENYGIFQTAWNPDQKTSASAAMANVTKSDETTKSLAPSAMSSDWINSIHSQISTKYDEFNRHLTDLKNQQEKINQILQQFPPVVPSRQGSNLAFAATTQ